MHVHLLIDAILPAAKPESGSNRGPGHDLGQSAADESLPRLPALEVLLAKGRRGIVAPMSQEAWLLRRFGGIVDDNANDASDNDDEDQPDDENRATHGDGAAAFRLLGDGGDAGNPNDTAPSAQYWLCADPVHLRVDRDALVLADGAVFDIRPNEAAALAEALNAHFSGEHGIMHIERRQASRWYARVAENPDMHCTPLALARGQPIDGHLPTGADAMRWHALMNEAQMVLHEHPVNQAREERGELPVNSLWFWGNDGPGKRRADAPRPFNQVLADDPLARGLAMTSGAAALPMAGNAASWLDDPGAPHEGQVLVVLDGLRAPASYGDSARWREELQAIEQNWFAPLLIALRKLRIGMLTCHMGGIPASGAATRGLRVEAIRGDLRRFWRRTKPWHLHSPNRLNGE